MDRRVCQEGRSRERPGTAVRADVDDDLRIRSGDLCQEPRLTVGLVIAVVVLERPVERLDRSCNPTTDAAGAKSRDARRDAVSTWTPWLFDLPRLPYIVALPSIGCYVELSAPGTC